MKKAETSRISRRQLLGTSLSSSAALFAGTASTSTAEAAAPGFKTTGASSMTLEEFRSLNGEGSVGRLIGSMDCDLLASCHKRMKEDEGLWIPELEPMLHEIDARTHPTGA